MAFSLRCPKCERAMEEGYIMESTQSGNGVTTWIEGPPERSFWTGMKVKGRANLPIRTFRCTRCGYLESYAPSQ